MSDSSLSMVSAAVKIQSFRVRRCEGAVSGKPVTV